MCKGRSLGIVLLCVLLGSFGCARKPDDAAIANTIKAQLFSDATLKTEPVAIAVNNGEATLTGEVSSEAVRQQLITLAQVVPGVVKVNDALQIKPLAFSETVPPVPGQPPVNYNAAPVSAPPVVGLAPPPAAPAARPAPTAPPTAPAAPLTTAANAPVPAAAPAPTKAPEPPPPPQPRKVVIPAGSEVRVITTDAIDSDKSKIGSTFLASLYAPLTVGEEVVIPKGANVSIKLLDAATAGKMKGKSEIQIGLDSVEFQGKKYPLQSSTYEEAGKSQGKQTAKRVGIGAAVGTAVGAIAGGGKGAAIGAGIGAGAGVATQAFKKGDKLQIPSETKIDFTLEKAVEVTIPPSKAAK